MSLRVRVVLLPSVHRVRVGPPRSRSATSPLFRVRVPFTHSRSSSPDPPFPLLFAIAYHRRVRIVSRHPSLRIRAIRSWILVARALLPIDFWYRFEVLRVRLSSSESGAAFQEDLRCDVSSMDSVPPNLRLAYQVLIDFFNEMEQELAKEGKADRVYYAKFVMKKCIRAYLKEAQWLNAGYIPKCDEYLENGSASIGIMLMTVTSLVGLEELITKETLEWVINDPLILRASGVIRRLKDDIIGHNFEQQRGHVASFIECYMKEYGASKQEAYAAVDKEMANAWKDINTEFLRPSQVPTFVLERVINPTRLVIGFQESDFINTQGEYKDKITSLLVDSVKI
uniref:(E,E)-germacrene B synthase-like n=1 Tax=Nicotiana tabacum TaxID=4097 RepID=A0A1S4AKZ9_TOBAC|nr:PREDICTED: (E,E)-germacrene B synthase-like [Nicotiana tabacum]